MNSNKEIKNLSGDEILDWIFEHDLLAEDFIHHFGIDTLIEDNEEILLNVSEVKNYPYVNY